MEKADTVLDRRRRVKQVMIHIDRHLDHPLLLNRLADVACYSSFHFLRVFAGLMGETPRQYVVRKKMEKAGLNLLKNRRRVIDIAVHLGYETASSFCKVFKAHYGLSPRRFRDTASADWYLKTNRFFHPAIKSPAAQCHSVPMIRRLGPMKVVYVPSFGMKDGSFMTAGRCGFERLIALLDRAGLASAVRTYAGIYPYRFFGMEDNRAQIWVGAVVESGIPPIDGLDQCRLPSGRYAVFNHLGSYEFLLQTWNAAYLGWLPASGHRLRDAFPLEIYLEPGSAPSPSSVSARVLLPVH